MGKKFDYYRQGSVRLYYKKLGIGSAIKTRTSISSLINFARMRSIDVPTRETLAFVLGNLPSGQLRLLEVGCGGGELAGNLLNLGMNW